MNARVKPPYDETQDDGSWGLRWALAYVSGARSDEIFARYDDWRATPRPGATRVWVGPARSFKRSRKNDERKALAAGFKPTARSDYYYGRLPWIKDQFGRRLGGLRWVGRGFAEYQTGLLLWGGQGFVPELNRAASLLERRCARACDPLVADGRDRNGIRRVVTRLEWADLVIVDAGSGPQVYDERDAMAAALGTATPAFSEVRFLVADVLKAFPDAEPAEPPTAPPAEPPLLPPGLPAPVFALPERPREQPSTPPAETPESPPAGVDIGAQVPAAEQSTSLSALNRAVEYFGSHEATDRDTDVKAAHAHFNHAISYKVLKLARTKAGVQGKRGRPAKKLGRKTQENPERKNWVNPG
jgi:hypothetical protein